MHRPRELPQGRYRGVSQTRLGLRGWVAVTAVACFTWSCIANRTSSTASPSTMRTTPRALSEAPLTSELSTGQERRAQAIAHYATGYTLEMDEGLDVALPEYERAFELDPRYTALGVRLAQIDLNRKDYAKAFATLEIASRANPESAEPLLWMGIAYRASDQTPKATATLKQALKLEPTNLSVMRALLDIYLQQNATNDAVALLDYAFREPSKDISYWMGLGDLHAIVFRQRPTLAKAIDRGRVRQCYEKAAALAPNDPDVLIRQADVSLEANDFQQAAAAYSKLLTLRPDLPWIRERLALTYIRADQKEKAIEVLEDLLKRDPLRFETYNSLADLYDQLDQNEKAIANYQQSLVLNPNQIEVYVRIVLAQLRLKKYDDAFKTLAEAKEKFPTRYQVQYLYGLAYSDQKEYGKAVDAFAAAERLAGDDSDESSPSTAFYFAYGSACERAGDFDKAVTLFKKSIELDPANDEACNYLGYMWADKGVHLDEAMDLIQRALKERPDSGAYIDSLGWVLFKLGRDEEALPQLQRAVELIKDDAVVYDHLAEVLLKLGKRDEAIEQWRRALQVEPGNKDIAEKLQKYSQDHTAAPK